MMNSKENYNKINSAFIVIIASTIFFRSLCTLLIMLYAVYNLIHFKFLKWPNSAYKYIFLLSLPLVFEIVFLWNNSSFLLGIKSLEKYSSLLIFSAFTLGNYQELSFYKIAKQYQYLLTIILTILLIRFVIIDYHLVQKYINGIDLWEMGYKFAESFGNHAPAINMHVAFLVVIDVYFLLKNQTLKIKLVNVLFLIVGILSLLIINTRIALAAAILGSIAVVYEYLTKKYQTKEIIKYSAYFTVVVAAILLTSFKANPFMKDKYSSITFAYMDKIGKLDEIENPEIKVFNAFVTRISIWKSAYELSLKKPIIGYGSGDGKKELVNYFKRTNQNFLAKYEFPVHNQYLDFFLKFGVLGLIMSFVYISIPIVMGIKSKNIILFVFGMIFFTSNLFDDFLIRFDGIIFFGIWSSLGFTSHIQKTTLDKL